jgi:hypothetical protein
VATKVLQFNYRLVDDLQINAGTTIAAGSTSRLFTDYEWLNQDRVTEVDESAIMEHMLKLSA